MSLPFVEIDAALVGERLAKPKRSNSAVTGVTCSIISLVANASFTVAVKRDANSNGISLLIFFRYFVETH